MKRIYRAVALVLTFFALGGCTRIHPTETVNPTLDQSSPTVGYEDILIGIKRHDTTLADFYGDILTLETEWTVYSTKLTEETSHKDLVFPLDVEAEFTTYGWELLRTFEGVDSLDKTNWFLFMVDIFSDDICAISYISRGSIGYDFRGSSLVFFVSVNEGDVLNIVLFD